jgi:hypothetical protein
MFVKKRGIEYNPEILPKKKEFTVGDRIRSMSDEELADWIYEHDRITTEKVRLNKEELLRYLQKKICR